MSDTLNLEINGLRLTFLVTSAGLSFVSAYALEMGCEVHLTDEYRRKFERVMERRLGMGGTMDGSGERKGES